MFYSLDIGRRVYTCPAICHLSHILYAHCQLQFVIQFLPILTKLIHYIPLQLSDPLIAMKVDILQRGTWFPRSNRPRSKQQADIILPQTTLNENIIHSSLSERFCCSVAYVIHPLYVCDQWSYRQF